eukprot:204366_1
MSTAVDITKLHQNLHNINVNDGNLFKLLIQKCNERLKLFKEIDKINCDIAKNEWNNYNIATRNAIRFEKYCTIIFLYGLQKIKNNNKYANIYPKFSDLSVGYEICSIKQNNFLKKYYNQVLGEYYQTFSECMEKIIRDILNCNNVGSNDEINCDESKEITLNKETETFEEKKTMSDTYSETKLNLPTINNFQQEIYKDLTSNNPNRYCEKNIFHRRESIKKNIFDTNLLILPKKINENKINNIYDIQNEINQRLAIQNSNQINSTRYMQYVLKNSANNNDMIKCLLNHVNEIQDTVLSLSNNNNIINNNNNNNNNNSNVNLIANPKKLKKSKKKKRKNDIELENAKRLDLVKQKFGGYCTIENLFDKLNLNENNDIIASLAGIKDKKLNINHLKRG